MLIYTLLVLCLQLLELCDGKKLSRKKSLVFGPALSADIVVPVRYFYIQAVDAKGKNYTTSPGKDTFKIDITSPDDRVRAWIDILDRNDGSFIVRYRLYGAYKDMSIQVKYDGSHVGKSPYIVKGVSYQEKCYCPEHDIEKWLGYMSCEPSYKQIDEGFKSFPTVNLTHVRIEGIKRFGVNNAICHYSIIKNQVYRKCYGQHVGFAQFSDAWFLSLARKVVLPDMEFIFNLGDWPLSQRWKDPIPVISWGGSNDTYDLVIPTYDLSESVLEALGRTSLDMMSVQGNTGPQWKDKIEKGLFRGRDSRQERLDLTVLGRSKPDLFDVGLTHFFFFKHDEEKYGPKNQHISFFDFFKHKYQLNVDGTVAAYRFPYLLVGDAVVFKQDSPYFEHFYKELEPMKHYIPFKRDLSDIEEKLKWAKSHDEEVHQIGRAGQQYARDNLMSDKLFCYTYTLFLEYSKRFIQKAKIHPGQQHIAQPNEQESWCSCKRKRVRRKNKENEENTSATGETTHEDL